MSVLDRISVLFLLYVIGHGIGGKYIPVNMARLAESQLLE